MKRALVVLLVLVMLSMASLAMAANEHTNENLKLPEELTKEELMQLYRKYNVTENDIKFAKGELPHYLEGTILGSNKIVVVAESGNIPEKLKNKLEKRRMDYIVLSYKEMLDIVEKARKSYIEKYGVDPRDPRAEVLNGVVLPKEYVRELAVNNMLKIDSGDGFKMNTVACGNPNAGPHAINGVIDVWIVEAKDSAHKPDEPYMEDTITALERFENTYNLNMDIAFLFGIWDASDVGTSSDDLLDDLAEDLSWLIDDSNDIVLGWVRDSDRNGVAYPDGVWDLDGDNIDEYAPFALNSVSATGKPDWPHDSIVQHETSHLFGAKDQGWTAYDHPPCIMNYWYAYWGVVDIWCVDCENCIESNIYP